MINKEQKTWHRVKFDFSYLTYEEPKTVVEITASLYGSSFEEALLALAKIARSKKLHSVKIYPIDLIG